MSPKETTPFCHNHPVTPAMRASLKGHSPLILWFTGLSGSGKSTLAGELELLLHEKGVHTALLDGDNVRRRLCSDLGLSEGHRCENIRRISETAGLLFNAGLVVLCAFITPYERLHGDLKERFGESLRLIHVSTPLDTCRQRDPKGLYQQWDESKLTGLTGLDAPYETPRTPDITVDTSNTTPDTCARILLRQIEKDLF